MGRASEIALTELAGALAVHGLMLRGGFDLKPEDGLGEAEATVLLVGNAGPAMWNAFSQAMPPGADPLDRWTKSVVQPVAGRFGARAVYPFEGPPWFPFQRWALRCDDVHVSPIGVLVHPRFGPWHAYRAALVLPGRECLPERQRTESPCDGCIAKPCLSACPVRAFSAEGYDVAACTAHIRSPEGGACMTRSCRARVACPVGAGYRYGDAQAAFHMAAFERARQA